jgi:hypothetical protein
MTKRLFGVIAVCALAVLMPSTPVAAQTTLTCADCGITDCNAAGWWLIDASGDGHLSTFDLALLQRVVNYQFGICIFFREDIAHYANAQTDFNGDGVFDHKDQEILNAIEGIFILNGNPDKLDLCKTINCLRMLILGICP